MALLDMFGREIEAGDVIVDMNNTIHPLTVISVELPSLLDPASGQAKVGRMRVGLDAFEPIPNPMNLPNVQFANYVIIRKGEKPTEPEPATPTLQ